MQWEVEGRSRRQKSTLCVLVPSADDFVNRFDSDQARPIVGPSGSKLISTLMVLHCITEVKGCVH